jgi:mitogen-activated protein kinase kinase kinase 4
LKTYNNCRNCQDLNSRCDFETQESFEGLKRGLSSENTSTSRYRPFVDQNIKKMGVASLGYKLHQLIHMELARASYILQVDKTTNVFLKHQNLHLLYRNMLLKKIESFPFHNVMDPEDATSYTQTFGIPAEDWIGRFQKMGLPSFDRLYVFLVRVVMDIYHECLRMRMEHRPKGEPSSLSVRQVPHHSDKCSSLFDNQLIQ